MYQIEAKIELIAPFLYNRQADTREAGEKKTENWYLEDAKKSKIHSDENGLFVPAWNLKVTMIDAAKKRFQRAQSITDKVKAFAFPENAYWRLKEADEIHVAWGRIPPRTGPSNKIYRPLIKAGRIALLKIAIADESLPEEKMRIVLESAGLLIGLGAWRPEYGRFLVKDWKTKKL